MSNKKFKSLVRDAYGCFSDDSVFTFDKIENDKNLYTFKYDFYDESQRVWACCEEEPTKFIEINQ